MNIQNIAALAEQLQLLGFENTVHSILKRICFYYAIKDDSRIGPCI